MKCDNKKQTCSSLSSISAFVDAASVCADTPKTKNKQTNKNCDQKTSNVERENKTTTRTQPDVLAVVSDCTFRSTFCSCAAAVVVVVVVDVDVDVDVVFDFCQILFRVEFTNIYKNERNRDEIDLFELFETIGGELFASLQ